MSEYDTVISEDILAPHVFKQRGDDGWILGGITTKPVNSSGKVVTRYYFHFWTKK